MAKLKGLAILMGPMGKGGRKPPVGPSPMADEHESADENEPAEGESLTPSDEEVELAGKIAEMVGLDPSSHQELAQLLCDWHEAAHRNRGH